jgi:hypothetical protein
MFALIIGLDIYMVRLKNLDWRTWTTFREEGIFIFACILKYCILFAYPDIKFLFLKCDVLRMPNTFTHYVIIVCYIATIILNVCLRAFSNSNDCTSQMWILVYRPIEGTMTKYVSWRRWENNQGLKEKNRQDGYNYAKRSFIICNIKNISRQIKWSRMKGLAAYMVEI